MRKIFVFAIGTLFFVMLLVGCQEQQAQTSTENKRIRLVGAENLQLKHELRQCNNELKKIKNQLEESKKQFEKCQLETNTVISKAKGDISDTINFMIDEVKRLREENVRLETQIEALKKQ